MRVVHADLHIHTCLSPCAEREMSPSTVARQARERGLDLIAICDHNSAENTQAVSRAAEKAGLAVLPGIEITSREEVHVLGLFGEDRRVAAMQEVVYDHLPGENDPDAFGEQLVMDEQDHVIGHNRRLLIGATDLSLGEVVRAVHEFDGLAIASHVDRPSFSVFSQLGFIPEGLGLDAVEVGSGPVPALPQSLLVIRSSDAHSPSQIGARHTRFLVESPTQPEIRLALRQIGQRRILTGQ